MPENSVTIAGDLGQPASRLIEKISDAIGGVAKPWQIKRVAKAEAAADLIRAETQLKVSEIQRRGLERVVREEGIKQENIESISQKAAERLGSDAQPEAIDDDWLRHFFERCRLTSNEHMQAVWAKVLAGEATNSGSFSRRTVDIISGLDTKDAQLFARLIEFSIAPCGAIPVIYAAESAALQARGLTFKILTDLESLGLLRFNNITGFTLKQPQAGVNVIYGSAKVQLTLSETDPTLEIGTVILTESGSQIMSIVQPKFAEDILNEWITAWQEKGYNPVRLL